MAGLNGTVETAGDPDFVTAGDRIYCSGRSGGPPTGNLETDIAQMIASIQATLKSAGLGPVQIIILEVWHLPVYNSDDVRNVIGRKWPEALSAAVVMQATSLVGGATVYGACTGRRTS